MSPGLTAWPLGMFSVAGTTPMTLAGSPSSAIAPIVSITAADPDMSIFISCMPPEGLIEIPPESKVTPLPTRAVSGPGALVADHDQLRRLVGPGRDGLEAAHPALDHLVALHHLAGQRVVLDGELERALGQVGGRREVRGKVLQLAGAVGGLARDAGDLDRVADVGAGREEGDVARGAASRPRPRRRPRRRASTCSGRTGTRRGSRPRPAPRLSPPRRRSSGTAIASEVALRLRGGLRGHGRRDPRALRREVVALPEPDHHDALGLLGMEHGALAEAALGLEAPRASASSAGRSSPSKRNAA